MNLLSELVKSFQRRESVEATLKTFTPEWVDSLEMLRGSTARVDLEAIIKGVVWLVVLTPSFHGVSVKVVVGNDTNTQSRLSKDLSLRLNNVEAA